MAFGTKKVHKILFFRSNGSSNSGRSLGAMINRLESSCQYSIFRRSKPHDKIFHRYIYVAVLRVYEEVPAQLSEKVTEAIKSEEAE